MRRERGFIQTHHLVMLPAIMGVMAAGALGSGGGPATKGFIAVSLGGVIAGAVLAVLSLPEYPQGQFDPGSAGCFALVLPEIAAMAAGAFGLRAFAISSGRETSAHVFAVAGVLVGLAVFAVASRLVFRAMRKPA